MPITISPLADPTSGDREDRPGILAHSQSGDILERALRRYLSKEVSGRSVLVAGHRGAGKTTLVDHAIQTVSSPNARALRVSLYGPSLFPESRSASSSSEGPSSAAQAKPEGTDPVKGSADGVSSAQLLLMELTVSLYRSLAREMARSYERALASAPEGLLPRRASDLPSQLVLDLDDAPGPARLRRYWDLLGHLDKGVLFPDPDSGRKGQGARELVALASAAQAFRVIAGKIDHSEARSKRRDKTRTAESSSKVDPKAVIAATATIASSIAGAIGAFFLGSVAKEMYGATWIRDAAVAAGALWVALAARRSASLTLSVKSTTETSYKFIRDYKVDTLARELPNLIERFRHAGLAPVFVIDELDKVRNLDQALHDLIRELKPLVAEKAFFCFIADREYFEHLRLQEMTRPFAFEHTYFNHRLFVSYPPEQLRDF